MNSEISSILYLVIVTLAAYLLGSMPFARWVAQGVF